MGLSRLTRSMALLGAGIVLFLLIVSTPVSPPTDRSLSGVSSKPPAAGIASLPTIPRFRDRTLQADITFSHLQGGEHLTGLNEVIGSGACAFDYDNDGWVDLFTVNGSGQTRYYGIQHWWQLPKGNALYRNLGNGRFKEVTAEAGLKKRTWGMGCVSGDMDNDGDPELLLTNLGPNLLYRNNGDGTFTDITKESGITGEEWSTSAALADYDGDGLLDIYVANYLGYRKGAHTFEASGQFSSDMPPLFDATLYVGQGNRLYRNRGNLKFQDVTGEAGVENASGRSLSAIWLDVNDDQAPDLFVANDKGFPNVLFINEGGARFREAGAQYHINDARGSRSVSIGDIDNDGDSDLLLSTPAMRPSLVLMKEPTTPGMGADKTEQTWVFRDRARALGVGNEEFIEFSGWSIGTYDFNNDGWLDLFLVNGLPLPDPDSARLPQGQIKQLWLNQGGKIFRQVSNQAGSALGDRFSARGAAFADFDNDGDIDAYVNHNNDLGQLLMNESPPSHWLGIQLVGGRSNRDAIGARVWLQTKKGTQYRAVTSSNGFLSDSDRRVHFGLGREENISTLRVRWPDGSEDSYKNIPADRYIKITQGHRKVSEIAVARPTEVARKALRLRIGTTRPQHRVQYLRWQVRTVGIAQALPELEVAIRDADVKVRQEVIALLAKHKHARGLKLLIEALADDQTDVRLAAVEALQAYEAEESARWLLRAFADPDAKVRAAVADAFGFFFREEEAMIHRKYLALPYLIRMLEDDDPRARIAASRGLGDAERYRGVDPLIELLNDSIAEVRAQAARALGLLRERKAIPPLLALLQDPKQLPIVRAHVLIALKRLDYEKTDQLLREQLGVGDEVSDTRTALAGLETLVIILKDETDGVVINRTQIVQMINTWLEKTQELTTSHTPKLAPRIVEALALSRSRSAIDSLKFFAQHDEPTVRANAYGALIDLDLQNRSALAITALRDPSFEVRRTILDILTKTDIAIPVSALLEALKQPQTRLDAIAVLARYAEDGQVGQHLFGLAANPDETIEIRSAALEIMSATESHRPPLSSDLFMDEDPRIRAVALKYWAGNLSQHSPGEIPDRLSHGLADGARSVRYTAVEILANRHEAWAERALKRLMLDDSTEIGLRRKIVDALAARGDSWALSNLTRLARLRHDPLSKVALIRLADLSDAKTDDFMQSLLLHPNEEDDIRLLAARSLYPRHPKAVLAVLTGT